MPYPGLFSAFTSEIEPSVPARHVDPTGVEGVPPTGEHVYPAGQPAGDIRFYYLAQRDLCRNLSQ